MQPGSQVIWLTDPWEHGIGTIRGSTPHAWLWVEWATGHFDSYDPMTLELADRWEHAQAEAAADQFGAAKEPGAR